MATEKQIQANRNNAKKSTPPRTEQGKSGASQNALQPEDALDQELVRQLAEAQCRMRRLARTESGYFAAYVVKSRHQAENLQPHYLRPGYNGEIRLLGHAISAGIREPAHLARYDPTLAAALAPAPQGNVPLCWNWQYCNFSTAFLSM